MLPELNTHVLAGQPLNAQAIATAAAALLDEAVPVEAKTAFLRALAHRGETPSEIAGFVRAFLGHAVAAPLSLSELDRPAIDVCGTGGDKLGLFNVSTTAMFILAGAGVAVPKHGNRGITSPSGSADVLEALGGRIDHTPAEFAECLKRTGVAFMLAPRWHPAFKAVAPARQALAAQGERTMFNVIGPLLNPLQPACQLAGVFEASLVPVYAQIMLELGRSSAWAVHGNAGNGRGMDELSTLGPTEVAKVALGTVSTDVLATDAHFPRPDSLNQLAGGNAARNAEILESLLRGEIRGHKRDLVVLNAAAALVVAGVAVDLAEGIARATETLDRGAALAALENWRAFS